jgi:molybdenum-dependent DNA-binding transcriptional regulator ModE
MKNKKEEYTPEELRRLLREYSEREEDIMEDTDELLDIYEAVGAIPEADRIILYLYAELGSLRAVGRTLGVSYSTARKAVQEIKEKIFDNLYGNT